MADESKGNEAATLTSQAVPGPTVGDLGVPLKAASGSLVTYTRGNVVIVRDASNPGLAFVHSPGSAKCTVAAMSPCGTYIASGDVNGTVVVWTFTSPVAVHKTLEGIVGTAVADLSWNASSTRLAIVGDASKGSAVVYDLSTDTAVGAFKGERMVAVCYSHGAGEDRIAFAKFDGTVAVCGGPEEEDDLPWEDPEKTLTEFGAKVYSVAYSPDGSLLVCGASNGAIHVFSNTFERLVTIGDAHGSSGVYSLSFSADGTQFISCGADQQCKVWDASTRESVAAFNFGDTRERMQVGGVITQTGHAVTVSKDGTLAFFNPATPDVAPALWDNLPDGPTAVATGPISEAGVRVVYASFPTGIMKYEHVGAGEMRSSLVSNLGFPMLAVGATHFVGAQGAVLSFGTLADGKVTSEVTLPNRVVGIDGQQLGDDFVVGVVTDNKQILVFANGEQKSETVVKYDPSCVSVAPDGSRVVVGSSDKKKVHTFLLEAGAYTLAKNKATEPNLSGINSVAISPNGKFIAYGDATKEIRVVDADTKKFTMLKGLWTSHNARIESLSWTPSSDLIASTGFADTRVWTWSMATSKKEKAYRQPAAPLFVAWLTDSDFFCIDDNGVARCVRKKVKRGSVAK